MITTATWKKDMIFVGESRSGFPVMMDSETMHGGTDNGTRPMELIGIGLAGCTAMDVISILVKKREQVTDFKVVVNAPRSPEYPKVITSAEITYIFKGSKISEAAVRRAIELTAMKYCPAQIMLAQVFPIDLKYEIYETDGENAETLTYKGTWEPPKQD